MWLSADEAKSDVILAAAATLFGGLLVGWISALPLYPTSGMVGSIVNVIEIAVIVGLVPLLLARHREGTLEQSFALTGDSSMLWVGLLVASPIAVIEIVRRFVITGSVTDALIGRVLIGQPTIAPGMELAQVGNILTETVWVAVFAVGLWLFLSFLAVRSRPAFRSPEMDVTAALRTFGLGAAAAGLLIGLVRSLVMRSGFMVTLLSFVAVAAAILITDRYVPPRLETTRAGMLAPAIIVLVAHVLAGGGFFRGDLLTALHRGLTSAALVVAMAALVEAKAGWALPPIVAVIAMWPTCATPLPFGAIYC
jgi:hypothetical protein